MCLLIGCSGTGKTLLLKRLQACSNRGSYKEVEAAPSTIPTVGTELVNVVNGRRHVTVRELGGQMAPIWKSYYKDHPPIMYMVDLSNKCQVAASTMLLFDVLTHSKLQDSAVLLLLNKIDLPDVMDRVDYDQLVRLDEVKGNVKQNITVLEVSAREGTGLQEVAQWIDKHGKSASN